MKTPLFGIVRLALTLGGVLAALTLTHASALAAVTADFGLQGPSTVSGVCPLTVNFAGAVYGTPDTVVKYQYVLTIGGARQDGPVNSASIPADGALDVSTSILVDAAHAGNQSYTLRLISPPDGGVVGNRSVDFSVECGAADPAPPAPESSAKAAPVAAPAITPAPIVTKTSTPPPAAEIFYTPAPLVTTARVAVSAHVGVVSPKLHAPDGLGSTTDASSCAQHISSVTCSQALESGELVLVWNPWRGQDIDGYRVYRVDGGRHALVASTATYVFSGLFLDRPGDGFVGKCYAITAYYGTIESPDSNTLCVG